MLLSLVPHKVGDGFCRIQGQTTLRELKLCPHTPGKWLTAYAFEGTNVHSEGTGDSGNPTVLVGLGQHRGPLREGSGML